MIRYLSSLAAILAVAALGCGNGGDGNGNGEWEPPAFSVSAVTSVPGPDGARNPHLVALGDGFGLAYTIGEVGHLARLDAGGVSLWDEVIFDHENGWIHDLEANDDGLAVVWTAIGADRGLYFAGYDLTGQAVASATVTDQTNLGTQNPRGAAIAWNGSGYAVAWSSQDLEDAPNPNTTYIFFALLNPNGQIVGDAVIFDTANESASEPSMVWSGSGYGMAWTAGPTDPDIFFATMGADGAITSGPAGIASAGSFAISPSVAAASSGFGVAYMDDQANGTNNFDVYFLRIGSDGSPQGSAVKVSTEGDAGDPSLVCSGSKCGLAWSWFRSQGLASVPAVYFGEVDDSGEKLGDAKISEVDDAAPHPSLVWAGGKYAIVWHGSENLGDNLTQILLAR
jgi:hypothetical protein